MALLARFTGQSGINMQPNQPGADDGMLRGCGGDADVPAAASTNASGKCKKCAAKAEVTTRDGVLCAECATGTVYTRCRRLATAEPACGNTVLVASSGGDASTMGLDIAAQIMHCGRKRRWWADSAVVYIDTPSISALEAVYRELNTPNPVASPADGDFGTSQPLGLASGSAALAAVRNCVAAGLHAYLVPIESFVAGNLHVVPVEAPAVDISTAPPDRHRAGPASAAAPPPAPQAAVDPAEANARAMAACKALDIARATVLKDAVEGLNRMLSSCGSLDQKQELTEIMTRRLLAATAAALGIRVLMTCQSADRISHQVLMTTFSGTGFSLPMDVAPVDTRFVNGVPPLRPMPLGAGSAASSAAQPVGGDVPAIERPDSSSNASATGALSISLAEDGHSIKTDALTRLASNWYPAVLADRAPPGQDSFVSGGESWLHQLGLDRSVGSSDHSAASTSAGAGGEHEGSELASGASNGIVIFRPFAEVESKEAALYCRHRKLEQQRQVRFSTAAKPRTSLAHTSAGVLAGLQSSFPSTVHNVVRTMRKLVVPSPPFAAGSGGEGGVAAAGMCSFCCGLLPPARAAISRSPPASAGGAFLADQPQLCYRCEKLAPALK